MKNYSALIYGQLIIAYTREELIRLIAEITLDHATA
jgi:hypothetical protein